MIDADGDTKAGSAGDYEHIAALRIAVVARSKTRARPNAAGASSATVVLPTVFASAEPFHVPPAPIHVDVAAAGDRADSRRYRYRVFETIVPLKNASWRPSYEPRHQHVHGTTRPARHCAARRAGHPAGDARVEHLPAQVEQLDDAHGRQP